ncbi:hypothetical protein AURDEDRAFT_70807 [Auricularia subglabra TFB-10046 SS5]|nr:hypothetical protein AURDEDRAFT_70807 [Auricularia subglabra TFB-10046 SS5]
MTTDFFWAHAKHTVNKETLRLPKSHGGMNLFSPQSRNEAQYLFWTRLYLEPPETRPIWAFLADAIFRTAIIQDDARRVPKAQRNNAIYQAWKPNMQKLPSMLKKMLETARKAQVSLDSSALPSHIKESEPLWAHPALSIYEKLSKNSGSVKCLRNTHEVGTVEDLEELADEDELDHVPEPDCACDNCLEDRIQGCRFPHRCAELARDIISDIAERWNPLSAVADNAPEPAPPDQAQAQPSGARTGGELPFDNTLTYGKDRNDLFRAYGQALSLDGRTAFEAARAPLASRDWIIERGTPILAALTAVVEEDQSSRAKAAVAVVFPDENLPGMARKCRGGAQNSLQAIATGVCIAARQAPTDRPLRIATTNKQAFKALTSELAQNESDGWTPLLEVQTEISIILVDKSRKKDWPSLDVAKEKAAEALENGRMAVLAPVSLAPFDRPGIKLKGLTQQRARKAALAVHTLTTPVRPSTARTLKRTQEDLRRDYGCSPTAQQLWASITDKSLSRNVRDFLWKWLHNGHKTGRYFAKMKAPWKARAQCPSCDKLEDMEHILTECTTTGQAKIWDLARLRLEHYGVQFKLSASTVWGCATIRICDPSSKRDERAERAFRIIVSESAFLVWKLRCIARIEHSDDPTWSPSPALVEERWKEILRSREAQDCLLTKTAVFGNKALDEALVHGTWDADVSRLVREHPWLAFSIPGVLVGRVDIRQALGIG